MAETRRSGRRTPTPASAEFGMQYAGWTPGAASSTGLGARMLADQRIPVADGVTLSADVYTPATPGRYPAVVSFAAYNYERHTAGIPTGSNEIGSPPVFTGRGYCPVIVERRGMGRSDGETGMFFSEQDVADHETVIAWAAAQPWCDGDVVLFGTSYYAMTQPLVAARRPPALRAFFANELCTDFVRHLVLFGGVPALYFLNVWMGANFTREQFDARMSPAARSLVSRVTDGPAHGLLEKVVHHRVDAMFEHFMSATPVDEVLEIYARWLFDDKTRDGSIPEGSSPVLDRIEVPFVTVQNLGYLNLHQFGSYELFEKAATPDDRRWLILAPPTFDLPVYSWQGEALAFFDHVLRAAPNGYEQQPPVRYWVDGADTFAAATSFPPSGAVTTRLHLGARAEGDAVGTLGAEVPAAGSASWAAVPMGLPVLGGLERVATQTVGFELPIVSDVQFAGAVTVQLELSCTEIDSSVVARLARVDSTGVMHHLSMGAARAAARTVDPDRGSAVEIVLDPGDRYALVPRELVALRFSLTPGPVRLVAGERLRLDLASRADLLREGPGDGYAQFDLPSPPYLCRNTIAFPGSWIELDIVTDRERDEEAGQPRP